jgi:hypothetical protein
MSDDELALVHRFWGAFNERDLTGLEDLFADEYVNHAALPGTPPGPEGQAQLMERLWHAANSPQGPVATVSSHPDRPRRQSDSAPRNP